MSAAAPAAALAVAADHMGDGWTVVVVVAMVAMMGGMGWMMWSMMRGHGDHEPRPAEDPVTILKARYARGELTTAEYQERLAAIERPGD